MRRIGRLIVIEGPPGVGKSALADKLADTSAARRAKRRSVNPFLGDFYRDPQSSGFQAQVTSLLMRHELLADLVQEDLFHPGGVVCDSLLACDRVLAKLNLKRDELALYDRVFDLLRTQSVVPDLVVYLHARANVLVDRMRRGAGEAIPPKEYLEQAAAAFGEFFFEYNESPLLVVDTSEIDFVARPEDFVDLLHMIDRSKAGTTHYHPRQA